MKSIRLATYALLVCVAFSCSPQRWCERNYPTVESITHDTTISYVATHDTIRIPFVQISHDTTFLPSAIEYHYIEKKGSITAKIDIHAGKLSFKCTEDSLKLIIDGLNERITTIEHVTKVVTESCNLPHKTKFNYFATYWFWITFLLILGYIAMKYFKG